MISGWSLLLKQARLYGDSSFVGMPKRADLGSASCTRTCCGIRQAFRHERQVKYECKRSPSILQIECKRNNQKGKKEDKKNPLKATTRDDGEYMKCEAFR